MTGPEAGDQAPIAIVGAGPTGLALALGLARLGVRSVVLDRHGSTSEYSKAAGVHVRTMEIFRQWGVAERVLEAGELVSTLEQRSARSRLRLATFDFSILDDEANDPGLLMLEQGRTEAILLDAVRETGLCDVRFSAEVVSLRLGVDQVRLGFLEQRGGDGVGDDVGDGGGGRSRVARTVASSFVVGCDGADSFVRDALGLPFQGRTYSLRPMLADVRVDDERDDLPWPRIWNGLGGLTLGLRIRAGLWRIIAMGRRDGNGDNVPEAEVACRVEEVLGQGPAEVVWASRFRIHRRSSPRFRMGRVLLAGDAAHVHSPVGGQGMNAGVQDAHNLAWKLARVLDGAAMDPLLESYDAERREVVVGNVSRQTDLVTRLFLQGPAPVRQAAMLALGVALRKGGVQRKVVRRLAMIDLGYSRSPILDDDEPAAGRRLPDPLLRSDDDVEVRLYDLLPNGPAILEVSGVDNVTEVDGVEAVIRIGAGGYRDPSGLIRELLDGQDGWILVRPDRHVGWARSGREGLAGRVAWALGDAAGRVASSVSSRIAEGSEKPGG
jgi:2-polyprenyl-6-methoxyphenol hydroxylase-like FAD-dependent oxidoreductase